VSRICADLDAEVGAFRDRSLAGQRFPYVFVDATYGKARVHRRVVSQAVVVATGVCGDGRREVLGFAVGDSQDGAFWTQFLRSLKARGLAGVQLVIADAHLGLRQAVSAVMAGAAVQRCRVPFLPNVLAQVPKGSAEMVAAAIRTIFAQPDAVHVHDQLDVIAGMLGRQFPSSSTRWVIVLKSCWPSPASRSRTGRRSGRPPRWSGSTRDQAPHRCRRGLPHP
jgi:transposase-like protein